jgi:hypothetical protein
VLARVLVWSKVNNRLSHHAHQKYGTFQKKLI